MPDIFDLASIGSGFAGRSATKFTNRFHSSLVGEPTKVGQGSS